MLTLHSVCATALTLIAAASPAAAQISINIGRPYQLMPAYIGAVGGYRPYPPAFRPPIGVITRPVLPVWPVVPVISLRPTIYPVTYLNLFPAGYQTILVGNVAYHYYPALPPGATFVTVGGAGYYQAGGVWFRPYFTGGQNVFLAVPPPL